MRNLFFSLAIVVAGTLSAQDHWCSSTDMQNLWFEKHPELREKFEKQQQAAAELDREMYKTGYNQNGNAQQRTMAAGDYTIPVVFHILHTGGSENITDAQVQDALSILTRDFTKSNADTANVVVQFKIHIGNPKIEFRLATLDPNGNCTNGIIRHYDANTNWSNNFADYLYTWPPTRYLNVYVVKTMGSGAAGYTYLPGSGVPVSADAVVILSTYVGSMGTGNTGTSRALTHEVGHWLNLPHTWGGNNNPGVACGDDGVTDTPVTKGFNACNLNNAAICTPGVVENMQNYMDYAYCQRMYTNGQAARMQMALGSSVNGRSNLSSVNNLTFTGVTNAGTGCVPMLDIAALPTLTVCSGRSLNLVTYTSNATPTNYLWTSSNGEVISTPAAATTSITFNAVGTTTVTCLVSNSNGSVSKSLVITVKNSAPQITSAYSESFENSNFPAQWTVVNPATPAQKWEIAFVAASHGANSAFIPGENMSPNTIEILESPSYDFKNNPGALFTFKYAYAKQTATNKDIFKVQASKNCGASWTDIWVPNNTSLSLNSGGVNEATFVPSLPEEWKFYDVTSNFSFTSFKTEPNVAFRFYFQEDVGGPGFGNRFYLDEVNFTMPVGINEITKQIGFNVYPNPAETGFNLGFNLSNAAKIKYQVISITGAVLIEQPETTFAEGAHELSVNQNGTLSRGIYFVNLEMNGVKMSKKLVIN